MRLRCFYCCAIVLAGFILVPGLLLAQGSKTATPRTADGHPDLTGLWNSTAPSVFVNSADPLASNLASRDGKLVNFERDFTLVRRADPNKPLYKPQFWEKVQQGDQNGNTDDPSYGCMPGGVPRMGPPAKIVETPKELVFLHEAFFAFHVVYLDGRPHPSEDDARQTTWYGHSVGHWEGDTMVIDTVGPFFESPKIILDTRGHAVGENLHIIERFTRTDASHMTYEVTIDDPKAFTKPWKNTRTWVLMPADEEIMEYVCTENNKEVNEGLIKNNVPK